MPFVEKKVTCPYNKSHQILPARFGTHLVKCSKQHPHMKTKVCLFNALHHVLEENYDQHVLECLDRGIVDNPQIRHPYDDAIAAASRRPAMHSAANTGAGGRRDPKEEDWESEMVGVTPYDPTKKAMEKNVLRYIQGATKSERRAFRADERERHAKLEAEQKSAAASLATGASVSVNSTTAAVGPLPDNSTFRMRRPVNQTITVDVTRQAAASGGSFATGANATSQSGSFMSSQRAPSGVRPLGPPPVVPNVGRGRAAVLANIARSRQVGKQAAAATGQSEAGTFATSDFKSIVSGETESIISGTILGRK